MAVDRSQTYTDPKALERLRNGQCPECGGTTYAHGGWGGPRGCTLTDNGVAQRIAYQAQLDEATEVPNVDPGALEHEHEWTARRSDGMQNCVVDGCPTRRNARTGDIVEDRSGTQYERVDDVETPDAPPHPHEEVR